MANQTNIDWGSLLNAGLGWIQTGQPPTINFGSSSIGGNVPSGTAVPSGPVIIQQAAPIGDLIPGVPNWVLIVALIILILILTIWKG